MILPGEAPHGPCRWAPCTETMEEFPALGSPVGGSRLLPLNSTHLLLTCALRNTVYFEIQCKDIVEMLFIARYGALFVKTLGIKSFLALY